MSTLQHVILAQRTLQATGAKYALSVPAVRLLGAISVLSEAGGRATYGSVLQLLGLTDYSTANETASILAKRGFITREHGQGIVAGASTSLRITAAGHTVLSTLARVEREARASVEQVEVGQWHTKRKYVRSGLHVGEAAAYKKKKAEREAARRQDNQA